MTIRRVAKGSETNDSTTKVMFGEEKSKTRSDYAVSH